MDMDFRTSGHGLQALFEHYAKCYFEDDSDADLVGKLLKVKVEWSPHLLRCAGKTYRSKHDQEIIIIRLSKALLKKDHHLKSILLHEMIHAALMVHGDPDVVQEHKVVPHGDGFEKKRDKIIELSHQDCPACPAVHGLELSKTHSIPEEKNLRVHGYLCEGCGREEWRFTNNPPSDRDCTQVRYKGNYRKYLRAWEHGCTQDSSDAGKMSCFSKGKPGFNCPYHEHEEYHKSKPNLKEPTWVKVAEPAQRKKERRTPVGVVEEVVAARPIPPSTTEPADIPPADGTSVNAMAREPHLRTDLERTFKVVAVQCETCDENAARQVVKCYHGLQYEPAKVDLFRYDTTDLVVMTSGPRHVPISDDIMKCLDVHVDKRPSLELIHVRNGLWTKRISIVLMYRSIEETNEAHVKTASGVWVYNQWVGKSWPWEEYEIKALQVPPKPVERRNPTRAARPKKYDDGSRLEPEGTPDDDDDKSEASESDISLDDE